MGILCRIVGSRSLFRCCSDLDFRSGSDGRREGGKVDDRICEAGGGC